MRYLTYILVLIGGITVAAAPAHEGMLDSYGCHPNVAHGSYHCHAGVLAQRQYKSREQMLRSYKEREQERLQQQRPRPQAQPPSGG
jgi:hypothetical protein